MSTKECPNQNYEPDFVKLVESSKEAQKDILKALEASGALSCEYKNSQGQLQFCAIQMPGVRAGCAQSSVNHKTTKGCGSVNLVSNTINNMKTQIKCVLTNIESSNEADVVAKQRIKLKLGNVKNSVIDLTQDNSITVRMANITSDNTQSALSNSVDNVIATAVTQAQESANKAFSDPVSQLSFQEVSKNLQEYGNSANIKQSISKIVSNLVSDQEIEISAGDVEGTNIKLTQINAIDLVAEAFVDQITKDIFQNVSKTDVKSTNDQEQAQANTDSLYESNLTLSNTEAFMGSIMIVIIASLGLYLYSKRRQPF